MCGGLVLTRGLQRPRKWVVCVGSGTTVIVSILCDFYIGLRTLTGDSLIDIEEGIFSG